MITVTALVDSPLQKVWQYWTETYHITQWNAANEDWCCPRADHELKPGGRFSFRMEAKDGSMGFDFAGVYDQIVENQFIEYTMEDGRKARVELIQENDHTRILESFDPENENPHELQQQGWQAILDNFKRYAENFATHKLSFSILITAPVERVYSCMLEDSSYRQWTSVFNPTSHYKGNWETGSKILFIGTDEHGNEGGMVSRIAENVPCKKVIIEHLGMLQNGIEILSGPEIELWTGSQECYYFHQEGLQTRLSVEMDSNDQFESYFRETWPKALKKLKEICEVQNL